MKKFTGFAFFVIALLIVQFAKAQTADEVINNHIKAVGGKENLDKITNIVLEAVLNYGGKVIIITTTTVKNKLNRQDITVSGKTGFELLTDKEGWTYMPFAGMLRPVIKSEEDVKLNQSDLDVAGPLADYAAKGHQAVLAGKETIAGKTCYHIKMTLAGGKLIHYFIDSSTYMVSRKKDTRNVNGRDTEIQTDYADYREVEGVKMAFSLTQQTGTIFISGIKINQVIPESAFKPTM